MARMPHTSVQDLLDSGAGFARALPALAGALGQLSTDAPLERVREGLFYLGAAAIDRVREMEAEGQRALADVVAPDLLRPFPAATIVELSSERSVRRVPAGAEVQSAGPHPCRFGMVSEIRVGPWRAENARIERPADGVGVLRFELAATGALSLADVVGPRVRFFVDAGRDSALALVAHVLAHTSRAELAFESGETRALEAVSPYGTHSRHALAPEPDGPHTGLSLLREYFLLPDKFCFFELAGLASALRGSSARRATVTLAFREPLPAVVTIEPTAIRAHCVPATNLFRSSAEPWVFEPGRPSAPVRVAGLPAEQGGVYAVLGASAMPRDDDEGVPIALQPVRRFAAGASDSDFPYALSTKLETPPGGAEPELVVCLTSPRGKPPSLEPNVVSMDLLATNRARASALRPGDLAQAGQGMPPGVVARNIRPCSPYVPPPTGAEFALQVAVRAAVPDGDPLFALQSRLLAMVPRHGVAPATARANVARVMALQSVKVARAIDRQVGRRGYETRIVLDETPFQGLGDVALFLRLLHAAFEAQASVSRFYRCIATCTKSGARVVWPPEAS